MALTLRPYQEQALQDLENYWQSGKGVAPVVCLPTGAGKSLLISSFCERTCKEYPYVHIMVVVHSRELVRQNYEELKENWPEADAGIYSAGLNSRDMKNQIIFAGIQSVYNKIYKFPNKIDILICDEGHMIPRSADTRYGRLIKELKVSNPHVVIWCTTATPYRLDSGSLVEGEGAIFDGIAHSTSLKDLIDQGYLVPVISKGGVKQIDLEGVHIRAGEYAQNELAVAASDPQLIKLAVEEFVRYGKDRKSWAVYCCGVDHARRVAAEIRKYNVSCEVLTGNTPIEERDRILEDFKNRKLRCICNVLVLSVGFNAKNIDMIVLLMSTTSASKYVQIVGRGTRTYPGKSSTLLMDYGGNVCRFGVLDAIDPIKVKDVFGLPAGKPPMRQCPECRCIHHARISVCPACGFEYPIPEAEANHGTEAYSGAVLSDQQTPYLIDVKQMWVSKHAKPGKTPSVKIAFYDNLDKETAVWACLDHKGYAKEKAQALIKQLGGTASSVDEALKEWSTWRKVEKIQVKMEGKWPRITGFVFAKGQSTQKTLEG